MKNDDVIDVLGRIQRVDVPSFLFTRIGARIEATAVVPRGRLAAIAFALAVLLLANMVVLTRMSATNKTSSLGDVVEVMGMNASDQLYE